jgi:surfactin synthase thioesterase subunit
VTDENRWLVCRDRRPDAAVRLYCFPYVGGTSGEFLRWSEELPDTEVWGVVPPGRAERLGEPPFTRLDELVERLVDEVDFTAPFAFFGHSLGALVAFETARALHAAGRPGPERLFVSGHRPPHLPLVDEPISGLPWPEFRAEVERRYPAPPPELAEDDELYEEILETLRCDLALFETYRHLPGPPLDCPIVVASGVDDHWTEADLRPWARHTTADCRIEMVEGDHFYLPRHSARITRIIADAPALGRTS